MLIPVVCKNRGIFLSSPVAVNVSPDRKHLILPKTIHHSSLDLGMCWVLQAPSIAAERTEHTAACRLKLMTGQSTQAQVMNPA